MQLNIHLFIPKNNRQFTLIGLFLGLFLVSSAFLQAQISFTNAVPAAITICGDAQTFNISFTNTGATPLTTVKCQINFPTGIEYVPNSVSGTSITEFSITNLSSVTFKLPQVAAGGTQSFSVQATAKMSALTGAQTGTIFRNTINLTHSAGTKSATTIPFNVLYPALSITAAPDVPAFVGQTVTRSVTIINGGFGALSTFSLTDLYDSNIDLVSVNKGSLNSTRSIVTFSAADFAGIGDGDGLFENNETLVLIETIKAIGCTSTQSTLSAKWGCGGTIVESNKKFPKTTIALYAPNLVFTPTALFGTCISTTGDLQTLSIQNTGTGPARSTAVTIAAATNDLFTRVDPSTIFYQIGASGTPISVIPTGTTAVAAQTCFPTNPVGGFTVSLPNIEPGQVILLKWKTFTCATSACGAVNLIGWKYNAAFTDMCNSKNYTKEGTGQTLQKKNFSMFAENPADLVNGQTGEYVFSLTSATFEMPQGSNSYFLAEFDVPAGLDWSGMSNDLTFKNGAGSWTPSVVNYNNSTRKLTAKYLLPIPIGLPWSEFRLKLTANCANVSNNASTVNLGFALFYVMDGSCASPIKMPLTCFTNPQTQIHCPGGNCLGMSFESFTPKRYSKGSPDNNQDGLADASGSLDLGRIALNRVMASDTFQTTFKGTIKTNNGQSTWNYAYAKSKMGRGSSITALSAVLSVTDFSTGLVKTATILPSANTVSGGFRTTTWNLSPAVIGGNFAGFSYENGDKVTLTALYQLSGNIGATMEQISFTNEFYTTPTSTSNSKFQCDNWSGNLTLVGYNLSNFSSDQYDVEDCTKQISQNFGLFIGQTAVAGGMDMFPFEYRKWAIVRDLQVTMPAGYTFVSANMSQKRTVSGNLTATQNINSIVPTTTTGQLLTFNLEQNYSTAGGSLLWSDDGFNGTVNVTIKPSCSVSTVANAAMPWQFTFKKSAPLDGSTTAWVTSTADRVKYKPAVFTFSSPAQTCESVTPVATWDVDLKNSTSTIAYNSWFHFQNTSQKINITKITNRVTGAIIAPNANGFYQIGTMAGGATTKIKVFATYTNCSIDQISLAAGYSCDGYPTDFATTGCPAQNYLLYNDPQESELQVKMTCTLDPTAGCSNRVNVEIEMLGSKLGATTNMELRITPPTNGNILVQPGSTFFKYPSTANDVQFGLPSLTSSYYSILMNNLVPTLISTGMPGVTNTNANLFKVKFQMLLTNNYRPGDLAGIEIFSKKTCGESNSASSFDFDPGAVFIKKTGIGLDGALDAWSASWMDYNNDGNPDLFIGTASANDPNVLYKNNGNGTFSKVTTGAIVTENSKSFASTWADTDNDGDVDGFVSTDVGQKKLFYQNNGNGTFTKITTGALVEELGYSRGAAWADYDNDGWVDLFVADYFSTKFNLLFHNNGDGTFTKVTSGPIATEAASSVAGVWGDYNNDGLIDLFVANTNNENNCLYKNLGGGQFEKITSGAIVNDGGKSVGASWGDIDNDGDLDLFVTNGGQQSHFLYKNNGDGTFARSTTGDAANDANYSNGSSFVDYDNDGDLDLFVANDQLNNNSLYSNDGTGNFRSVSGSLTQDGGQSFATAWADYDNDGDMDALVANRSGGDLFFYQNGRGQCNTFLCMKLVGTRSNRSAIGAKIRVKGLIYGQSVWQMHQISAQSGGGVGSQDDMKALFGLGQSGRLDSVIIEWPSGFKQTFGGNQLLLNSCQTITEPAAARVCGHVWLDTDGDCIQNNGEPDYNNTRIKITPGNFYTATDAHGDYEVYLANGTYSISAEPQNGFTVTCPANGANHSVTVSSLGEILCGNDFGLHNPCPLPDLSVDVVATSMRIGHDNLVVINYQNHGTMASSYYKISVNLGQNVVPISASVPWAEIAVRNTPIWVLHDLMPGQTGTIYLTARVAADVPVGKMIEIQTNLNCSITECDLANNQTTKFQQAVGSFDPNDILVSPEGEIRSGQELSYKIRFQNVGTFLAKKVVVDDILPENLDLSTLVFGAASHPYKIQVSENGRHLTWIFENINLQDSTSNEVASHGFVTFKIRPKLDLTSGTKLPNFADIRFDENAVVRTNTVVNFIKNYSATQFSPNQVAIIPNPARAQVQLFLPNIYEKLAEIEIYDLNGRKIWSRSNAESLSEMNISVEDWAMGTYFVKVFSEKGAVFTGKLVVIH
jgi:uncharacterized repeat protein (TIGR01451 family)